MLNKRLEPTECDVGGAVAVELASSELKGYTEEDRKDMWRMGKKQELRSTTRVFDRLTQLRSYRRNFRFISTIGYATCVYGTWEILLT